MADCAGLEIQCGRKLTVGSNPTLSAFNSAGTNSMAASCHKLAEEDEPAVMDKPAGSTSSGLVHFWLPPPKKNEYSIGFVFDENFCGAHDP